VEARMYTSANNELTVTYEQNRAVKLHSLVLNFSVAAVYVGTDAYQENFTCPISNPLFKCSSQQMCVPMLLKCDGHSNCPGGEDEADCPIGPGPDNKSGKKQWVYGVVGGVLLIVLVAAIIFAVVRYRRGVFLAVPTNSDAERAHRGGNNAGQH